MTVAGIMAQNRPTLGQFIKQDTSSSDTVRAFSRFSYMSVKTRSYLHLIFFVFERTPLPIFFPRFTLPLDSISLFFFFSFSSPPPVLPDRVSSNLVKARLCCAHAKLPYLSFEKLQGRAHRKLDLTKV